MKIIKKYEYPALSLTSIVVSLVVIITLSYGMKWSLTADRVISVLSIILTAIVAALTYRIQKRLYEKEVYEERRKIYFAICSLFENVMCWQKVEAFPYVEILSDHNRVITYFNQTIYEFSQQLGKLSNRLNRSNISWNGTTLESHKMNENDSKEFNAIHSECKEIGRQFEMEFADYGFESFMTNYHYYSTRFGRKKES